MFIVYSLSYLYISFNNKRRDSLYFLLFIVRNVIHLWSFGSTKEGQKTSDAASGPE